MTVKPKTLQSTNSICCGSQYIYLIWLCLHVGMADYTPHVRITAATLVQGACANLTSVGTTAGVP
jgi:hypothetical protein